ncbi:MAG: PDDEXK nuclease domain-containing protein [Lentimicrobiaceae bacterium]|jgi:predicted nuclease of restriction endonuclease-like (RecB) superfamily
MNFETLIQNLQLTHNTLFTSASKAINTAMTIRNWLYGYYIVEYEQNGEDRAGYGDRLIRSIEKRLKATGQKGMSFTNLNIYRQFYLTYPQIGTALPHSLNNLAIIQAAPEQSLDGSDNKIIQAVPEQSTVTNEDPIRQAAPDELRVPDIKAIQATCQTKGVEPKPGLNPARLLQTLSFTHIVELIKIDDPLKRAFYEIECVKGTWSTRELQRQIESLYFERSGLSKDKKKLSEMVRLQAVQLTPHDVINNPFTIEFLGLNDRALVTESDLEQALLDHLQEFLLELGYGFCFEARQKRILIDGEYYFIDLVFYHRILKCHVLVDLKIEKFKHSHAGQLNAYLNYYRNEVMQEEDNSPVGILLCTDKGETMAKYATAGLEHSVFVHKYQLVLPSREELEEYISKEISHES